MNRSSATVNFQFVWFFLNDWSKYGNERHGFWLPLIIIITIEIDSLLSRQLWVVLSDTVLHYSALIGLEMYTVNA